MHFKDRLTKRSRLEAELQQCEHVYQMFPSTPDSFRNLCLARRALKQLDLEQQELDPEAKLEPSSQGEIGRELDLIENKAIKSELCEQTQLSQACDTEHDTYDSGWGQSAPFTIKDIKAWDQRPDGSIHLWNFAEKEWEAWRPSSDLKRSRQVLWKWIQKILKVIYFKTHTCDVGDLERYVPKELLDAAFPTNTLKSLLSREQKHLHDRILNQNLLGMIIPRWKKRSDWAVGDYIYQPGTKFADDPVLQYFDRLARSDPDALQRFFSPLQECIDWREISQQISDNDKRCFEWGVRCLTRAAAVVCSMALDTAEGGQLRNVSRNKAWIFLAADAKHVPHVQQIRLYREFGSGKRSRISGSMRSTKSNKKQMPPDNLNSVPSLLTTIRDQFKLIMGSSDTPETKDSLAATGPEISKNKRGRRRLEEDELTEEALARRVKRRKERLCVAELSGGLLFEGRSKKN